MRDAWRKKHCVSPGCTTPARAGDWCDAHDPARYHRAYLPAEPLVALVEAAGGLVAFTDDPALRRAYARAKSDGRVTEMQADKLALLVLRRHPWEVWDEWFSTDTGPGCSPNYPQDDCATVDA